ncbi:BREX system Lon protease-like protein BrxL [Fusobacterium sp.]|uniref:BREX system Lon protease-like protein BrxL n=1 Tax=Fusobacterium sp. TaxID=68766 RepID=UPI002E7A3FE0|nr:BREX system Lon protease-like protein BrxL [Fusobacterium sp.]MEE1475350.1 BREX system Lon protease-like protein BrxL [Fusobacterium sp.]
MDKLIFKSLNLTPDIENNIEFLKESTTNHIKAVVKAIIKKEENKLYAFLLETTQQIKIEIILTLNKEIPFTIKYKNKLVYAEGIIKYSPDEDKYTFHNFEVIEYNESIKNFKSLFDKKSLLQRIDILLSFIGLDTTELLSIEKTTYILRLIPLIEKLIFYVEVGPSSIGKTTMYKSLDLKINSSSLTKAKVIKDERTKTDGEFLSANSVYIIDEFQKTLNPELIIFFQTYFGSDKEQAIFSLSDTEKRKMDTSLVLCGNLANNNSNSYNYIFSKKLNVFSNTKISNEEDIGEALIKRINFLIISNGCRRFQPSFLKKDRSLLKEQSFFLKCYCQTLREHSINLEKIFEYLNIDISKFEDRVAISITKGFDALLKLLYPELLVEYSEQKLNEIKDELYCILDRIIERVKASRNMLAIISQLEDEKIDLEIYSEDRKLLLPDSSKYYMAPHRALYFSRNDIVKIPLDKIGFQQNQDEFYLLNDLGFYKGDFNFDSKTGILKHYKDITRFEVKCYNKIFLNKNWKRNLSFNYSTGENEIILKKSEYILDDYSFYFYESR